MDLEKTLAKVVADAVREALAKHAAEGPVSDRIGYTEPEAAAMFGIASHVLRDCRLRGEIEARRVGKRYVYSAASLRSFLKSGG